VSYDVRVRVPGGSRILAFEKKGKIMPQLRIRDVNEALGKTKENLNERLAETNKKLDQLKNVVYILAVVQCGLVGHVLANIFL
jgi:hypothetical protein